MADSCEWFDISEKGKFLKCDLPATHIGICDYYDMKLCEGHSCKRHDLTFEAFEKRNESRIIPNWWFAL